MISAASKKRPFSSCSNRVTDAKGNTNHSKHSYPAKIVDATGFDEAIADIKINMTSAPTSLVPGSNMIIFDLKKPRNPLTNQKAVKVSTIRRGIST